jgi:hypothetical protein
LKRVFINLLEFLILFFDSEVRKNLYILDS